MRIIKGAEKSEANWTVRKLIEMMNDGYVNFNIDIQRGYVWKDITRRSALIRSLILDRHIPPLYFNLVDDVYEGNDGKQRAITIQKFINNEFELKGLEVFHIINDDGEEEEFDINRCKFDDLPECFQNAIKDYNFKIYFTIDADQEEVAETFYNLNNGQKPNSATLNRVKAKSKKQIIELSKHKLFTEVLKTEAIEGHVNDDLVGKAHAILNAPDVSMNASWIHKYLATADITDDDEKLLNEIFDRIRNVHGMIEDNKIAKRMYGRTHMISIVPVIKMSLDDGLSEQQVMEWFVNFFSGKRSATISDVYNRAAGRDGTGKNPAVMARVNELKKNYYEFFKDVLNVEGKEAV